MFFLINPTYVFVCLFHRMPYFLTEGNNSIFYVWVIILCFNMGYYFYLSVGNNFIFVFVAFDLFLLLWVIILIFICCF